MATTTTNLGLIEPAGQDRALVANINTNSEKIDAEAGKARANFALVQNGDTATQAISQGQLVVWKGALKKATANIANGATLSSSNLTDDSIATEIASLNSKIENIGLSETGTATITMDQLSFTQKGSMYIASVSLPDETHNIPTGVKIAQVCKYGGGIVTVPFAQTDNDGNNLNVLAIDNPGSNSAHYIVVRWYK